MSLDDFEQLHCIGKGGFGKVYMYTVFDSPLHQVMKVMKKDTKKIYAMKVMHKTKISGNRQLQCLIAENPYSFRKPYLFSKEHHAK